MDKITPHMYSAGALLLIAIFCTYQGIFTFSETVEITNTEFHLRSDASSLTLLESEKVMGSLGSEPRRMFQNPFLEPLKRDGSESVALIDVKAPKPPPPIFMLPLPPVLPLPGDQ